MATVYHQSAEPMTATRSPFAFDRFCDELRSQAATFGTTLLDVRHRSIAELIGCSAARIHEFMQRLEDRGQIIREPFKNRYLIDVSPLIDQPDRSGVGDAAEESITLIDQADRSGLADDSPKTISLIDQGDRSGGGNPDAPQQDAPNARSSRDRVKTVCMESLETTTSSFDPVVVETSRARATMVELGAEPPIIADAFTSRPDWTAEQVRARWAFDQERIAASGGRLNDGVFFHALRRGQLAPPRRDPASDWHALAPPDDDRDPPEESPQQRARRICPDDASGHDFQFLLRVLAEGASDEAALAALAALAARGKRGGR